MIDVLIVGSGPAGLSTAIEAKRAGLSTIVFDQGSLVDSIRRFPTNLTWFSTPELLEIGGVPFVCSKVRPSRVDTLVYYRKVTEHFGLNVRTFESVESVHREEGGFVVGTSKGNSLRARSVVIATGYFNNPGRLGVEGESSPHVRHYYVEPFECAGLNVAVIGGRNSAVEAALDLFRNGAHVTLIHRGNTLSPGVKYWILPDIENRLKSGEIRSMFQTSVVGISEDSVIALSPEGRATITADIVFVLIGFKPDTRFLASMGVDINAESLAPVHNPSTFETNVPGLFVAGSIVAGKFNNKIFVENGRLHGAAIIAAILSR